MKRRAAATDQAHWIGMSFTVLKQPWPYLAIAAFAVLIGGYVWTQPDRPGTRYFASTVVVRLVWTMAAAIQVVARSPDLCCGLWVLQIICALLEVPLDLMFSLEYTGNEKWLARRNLASGRLRQLPQGPARLGLPVDAAAADLYDNAQQRGGGGRGIEFLPCCRARSTTSLNLLFALCKMTDIVHAAQN